MMKSKFKYPEMIAEETNDGGLILFDKDTGNTHIINSTAKIIYDLCIDLNEDEIAQKLMEQFSEDGKLDDIKTDVKLTIIDFLDSGIIKYIGL